MDSKKYYLAIIEYLPEPQRAGGFGLVTLEIDDMEIIVHKPILNPTIVDFGSGELGLGDGIFWMDNTKENMDRIRIIKELPVKELWQVNKEYEHIGYDLNDKIELHNKRKEIIEQWFTQQ